MKLDPAILDLAYATLEEFGPERGKPVAQRLMKEFPRLSDAEREEIVSTLEQIRATVWALAEQGGESKMKKVDIIAALQAAHPFLQGAGLEQAAFLVNYFAWHEGYDQKPK